ncbi:uncharacterized protein LOC113745878 [Larimichthys crocea]|uniref:uncharacterized protein LOC113745878 n=1 Tax=Larimichthys crocea TaxID=215358 RepID=UPI000F5E4266|nr:uncharacterized protein LOC113745878 [Larimichthys crocea]
MAGHLLLVVLLCFFSEMRAQDLLPPELTVNPPMITETDSVTLNCQTPSSVSVPQCYFHFVRGGRGKSFPCLQTLTGTELLKMSHQSSPAEVKVTCFYLKVHQSPDSDVSSIIIGDILDRESSVTQTMSTLSMTTGVTVYRSGASTPIKLTSGWPVGTHSSTVVSTSTTPVKPASGSTVSTPSTKDRETPLKTDSEKMILIGAIVAVGVVLLGLALLFSQVRIDLKEYLVSVNRKKRVVMVVRDVIQKFPLTCHVST